LLIPYFSLEFGAEWIITGCGYFGLRIQIGNRPGSKGKQKYSNKYSHRKIIIFLAKYERNLTFQPCRSELVKKIEI
jgi:hypothetical protein